MIVFPLMASRALTVSRDAESLHRSLLQANADKDAVIQSLMHHETQQAREAIRAVEFFYMPADVEADKRYRILH